MNTTTSRIKLITTISLTTLAALTLLKVYSGSADVMVQPESNKTSQVAPILNSKIAQCRMHGCRGFSDSENTEAVDLSLRSGLIQPKKTS